MTVLDSFLAFAKALPADRLGSIEDALLVLMQSYSAQAEFSASELAILDHRVAEERPAFARKSAVEQLLGKKLPG